jgi:hypothetical protein
MKTKTNLPYGHPDTLREGPHRCLGFIENHYPVIGLKLALTPAQQAWLDNQKK